MRFEDTVPETMRVEVTVRFEVMAPPRSVRVAVATDPLFVTERSVSASAG